MSQDRKSGRYKELDTSNTGDSKDMIDQDVQDLLKAYQDIKNTHAAGKLKCEVRL